MPVIDLWRRLMAQGRDETIEVGKRSEDGATLKLVKTSVGIERLEFTVNIAPFNPAVIFGGAAATPSLHTRILADYDPKTRIMRTFPTVTNLGSSYLLDPKYRVAMLAIEGQSSLSEQLVSPGSGRLESLPSGFVRDPFDGLGLIYPLRYIIQIFDDIKDLKGVVLITGSDLEILDGFARVPLDHFHKVRKAINRAHEAALEFAAEDKVAYLNATILAPLLPGKDKNTFRKPVEFLRQSVQDALIKPAKRRKENTNAEAAIRTVRRSASDLASDAPAELYRLNREIESIALGELIVAFENKLQKKLNEQHWQNFFTLNPFILRLAFGFPVTIFGQQVSVGGGTFNGSGGKLADYVVRSGLLGNLSLVEIKKPGTGLVEAKPYRGGVHSPTKELSGAVTQVLDQRYRLQGQIGALKINSKAYDVFAYSIQCIVVAGLIPDADDTRKSLELYRSNLRDVIIITFDELIEKLKALRLFLSADQEQDTIKPQLLGDNENEYDEEDYEYPEDLEEDFEGDAGLSTDD